MAVTADGKVDTVERRGARISGPADTARVDALRAEADAVMVGGHTLLAEDPRLTVRDPVLVARRRAEGRPRQPAKVAIVTRVGLPGEPDGLPAEGHFLRDGGSRVLVCTTARTDAGAVAWLERQGAEVLVLGDVRVDLVAALDRLHAGGIGRLMVEGGGTLVAALLADGLVDELLLAVAPLIFGGAAAPTPVEGPGWPADHAPRLRLAGIATSDDGDVVLHYKVGAGPGDGGVVSVDG
jgi:2,5-diamino-6-(ribosylamino)-4(3H)-pyrimidinone 5'-phosphate reductase